MAITKNRIMVGKEERTIDFSLTAPSATKVMLAGSFNNWDYKNTPLKKSKDNIWQKSLTLKPGRYEYKFVVDGKWIVDPKNAKRTWSSLGTENSVIEVR